MAHVARDSRKTTFLPESATRFLRRRAIELGGLFLFLIAGLLALALASYDPADPSGNVASGTLPSNWLGFPGAWLADTLMQWLGLSSALFVFIIAAWAWRIVSHRGLPWFRVNLMFVPLAVLAAAVALAGGMTPIEWPLVAGMGGIIGDGIYGGALGLVSWTGLASAGWLLSLLFSVIAAGCLFLALGIDIGEWRSIGRGTVGAAHRVGDAAASTARAADGLRRRAAAHPLFRREPKLLTGEPERSATPRKRLEPRDGPDLRIDEEDVRAPAPKRRVEGGGKRPLKKSRRAKAEDQPSLDLGEDGEGYQLPPLLLLQSPGADERLPGVNEEALEQNARLLETVLDDYGVRGRIVRVRPGPVVTLYELEPAPGTKTSRVIGLADDIARSMSARSVRIAVVAGRNAIGIELPNKSRETVYLRELLSTQDYERSSFALPLALGKDIGGAPVMADLARMPHLLIAGTTGSGKSVAINTMILSLLYRMPPERCRMIMIDPKMLELSVYDDIPHLLAPVVTDPGKAIMALKWTVREMENRYRAMASLGVRNITGYNQRLGEAADKGEELKRTVQTGFDPETGKPIFEEQLLDLAPMPYIVVVVDEMADLMMVAGKDIEGAIQRLAQMARAAGIHLMMATQRPSVDVITGTIKANFPTRISFQVTSKIDSRTILGEQGAEQLLGMGDMLYMAGGGRVTRVHGPFVSDEEVESVVRFLKKQAQPEYLDAVTEEVEGAGEGGFGDAMGAALGGGGGDDMFDRAVDIVARSQKASTSFLQRQLKIGYNRAADLIDRMEAEGIIGAANHVGKREVLVRKPDED